MDRVNAQSDFSALFFQSVLQDSGIRITSAEVFPRVKKISARSIGLYHAFLCSKKWESELINQHISVIKQIEQKGENPLLNLEKEEIEIAMVEVLSIMDSWRAIFASFPNIETLSVYPEVVDEEIATFPGSLKTIIFRADGEGYLWDIASLARFRRLQARCPHLTQFSFRNCTFSKQSIMDYFPHFQWIKIGNEKISQEEFLNLQEGLYSIRAVQI